MLLFIIIILIWLFLYIVFNIYQYLSHALETRISFCKQQLKTYHGWADNELKEVTKILSISSVSDLQTPVTLRRLQELHDHIQRHQHQVSLRLKLIKKLHKLYTRARVSLYTIYLVSPTACRHLDRIWKIEKAKGRTLTYSEFLKGNLKGK